LRRGKGLRKTTRASGAKRATRRERAGEAARERAPAYAKASARSRRSAARERACWGVRGAKAPRGKYGETRVYFDCRWNAHGSHGSANAGTGLRARPGNRRADASSAGRTCRLHVPHEETGRLQPEGEQRVLLSSAEHAVR